MGPAALIPVAIAILFSFNAGRSRSVWQGFSFKWWWGDPTQSIFHNSTYTHALVHSLLLAGLDMVIATPLGVLLALGLARWRGRGSGVADSLMLIPLVAPEIVRAVSELARYGVGGRNLRVFRSSADREAQLLQSILAPALR